MTTVSSSASGWISEPTIQGAPVERDLAPGARPHLLLASGFNRLPLAPQDEQNSGMNTECRARRGSGLTFVLAAGVTAAAVLAMPGCRTVEATAELPGNVVRTVTGTQAPKPPDPVLLQQELFRFSDEFSAFAAGEFRRLRGKFPGISEDQMLESEIYLNQRLLEISAGPNAYANLVDMVFAVVLVRYQVRNHGPARDPEGLLGPTQAMLDEYHRQILALATSALGKEQQELLRENIVAWLDSNVTQSSGLHARYTGQMSELLGLERSKNQSALGGLFGALDPFSGLDPTVREIAQARLFAERAMYVAQRMPKVLQLELELFKRRSLATPEIARLLDDVDTVSRTVERIGVTVETLPDRLRDEREGLTELVREARATMDASTKAMESVNTVVLSTDTFLGHLGVGDQDNAPGPEPAPSAAPAPDAQAAAGQPAAAPAPPGEPFRIQDYTAAAAQLAETAERVNTLVTTLDRTLATATSDEVAAKVDAASAAAVARGREVVDHAFRRGLLFVALSCAMVLASVLGYRLVSRKLRT
jgi:hypothetical protein